MIEIAPGRIPGIHPVIGFIMGQLCEKCLQQIQQEPQKKEYRNDEMLQVYFCPD
jgi:hypothetical protein